MTGSGAAVSRLIHVAALLALISLAACDPSPRNFETSETGDASKAQEVVASMPASEEEGMTDEPPRHLQLAENLLQEAPSSSSVVREGTRELIAAALERGDTELAGRMVESLKREPFAYWEESARLARALAEAGRKEEATELLDRVLAGRTYFGGVFRDRIDLQVIGALSALGQDAEADEILETINDDSRVELAKAMMAVERLRLKGRGNFKVDASMMPGTYSPEYLPAAETLVGVVDLMIETGNQDAALGFAASLQDYVRNNNGNASRFYLKLTRTYWEHGMHDDLIEALDAGFPHFKGLSGGVPEYYEMVAEVARFSEDSGHRDVAEKLLEVAPKGMALLPDTERAPAYAHLGVGAAAIGNSRQADEFLAKAVEEAEALKNPAAIPVAKSAILLVLADAGIEPPESIAKSFAAN